MLQKILFGGVLLTFLLILILTIFVRIWLLNILTLDKDYTLLMAMLDGILNTDLKSELFAAELIMLYL